MNDFKKNAAQPIEVTTSKLDFIISEERFFNFQNNC